ncbi:MAG: flagellar M-ring protein FliF [Bdellovibrionales bacterium]|nr:flagellar M-ring protein FliF [Bdellovibrionales bacterium]
MDKLFGNLIVQFREFMKSLTPVKRAAIIGSVFAFVIALVIVTVMLSGANNEVLFRNIPNDQIPVVVSQLKKKNIPFQLADNGTTVLVPKELLHSTQMSIMTEVGSGDLGQVGLELFDKQDFGTTSYAQRINYQRALQGELMRAINTLTAVKHSKVILAIPPKKTFLEEQGETSASVVIELQPGKRLANNQVKGITHLVASSVEHLEPENVTVVDSRGKVLSKHYSEDGAMTAELLDVQKKLEEQLEDRIESILSKVVGTGKVIAKVNAQLDPRSMTTREEQVNPDATALKSQATEEELLDGARTNPAGIPGARAELPGAQDQGQIGFRQNVKKELRTQNYEVPKTIRNIKQGAGGIQRLSVAVLVDGKEIFETSEAGEVSSEWQERSQEEMTKYETLVKNAIGFSTKRGDNVSIENIRFEKEDFSEAERLLTTLERKKLLNSLFKWSLLGFSLALFFFIVVRPFMRWVTDSFQDSVEDMLPRTIEELEELQSVDNSLPGMSGALPVLEDSIDPDKAESELLKERIMALMEKDEEKAAGAFSLWLSRRDM